MLLVAVYVNKQEVISGTILGFVIIFDALKLYSSQFILRRCWKCTCLRSCTTCTLPRLAYFRLAAKMNCFEYKISYEPVDNYFSAYNKERNRQNYVIFEKLTVVIPA